MKIKGFLLTLLIPFATFNANAESASDNASAASKHSVLAVGHGVASTAQVASAVAVVPLATVGSVGEVSTQAANGLAKLASGGNKAENQAPETLKISDITITAQRSPKEAMQNKDDI